MSKARMLRETRSGSSNCRFAFLLTARDVAESILKNPLSQSEIYQAHVIRRMKARFEVPKP